MPIIRGELIRWNGCNVGRAVAIGILIDVLEIAIDKSRCAGRERIAPFRVGVILELLVVDVALLDCRLSGGVEAGIVVVRELIEVIARRLRVRLVLRLREMISIAVLLLICPTCKPSPEGYGNSIKE